MGTEGIPEVAKAGWFFCGLGWGLLLAVMRREVPKMLKAAAEVFKAAPVGDTIQITSLEQNEPPEGGTPEGSSAETPCI